MILGIIENRYSWLSFWSQDPWTKQRTFCRCLLIVVCMIDKQVERYGKYDQNVCIWLSFQENARCTLERPSTAHALPNPTSQLQKEEGMRWSKGLLTNDLSKIQRSLEFLPLICNVPSQRKISYGKRKARLIFIFAKFFLRSQFWLHNEMKVLKFLNHGGFIPKWHDCRWNYSAEKNMHICRWYISVCKARSVGIDHSWREA